MFLVMLFSASASKTEYVAGSASRMVGLLFVVMVLVRKYCFIKKSWLFKVL